jgi:hypothetical protein
MSELKEEKETKEPLKIKAKRPSNLTKRKEDQVYKMKLKKDTEEKVEDKVEEKVEEKVENKSDNLIKRVEAKEVKTEEKVPVVDKAPIKPEVNMPEGVEKLLKFMKDTGGGIQDYARLNADYSNVKDEVLLKEFYKKTKPHLDDEEIVFLLEDKFSFDEEEDDEKHIRKKRLAMKEEVANASSFMNNLKEQYYEDLKLRSNDSPDQQKALDFFNRYNKEQDAAAVRREEFKQNTNNFFTNDFDGFDFKLGDNQFKYGVSNPQNVADTQADLTSFIGKFLDKDGNVNDTAGYHKALYAARNADTLAEHFYEQGKADAVKDITAKTNNVSSTTRNTPPNGDVFINGLKVKAISGVDSSKLKIKRNNKN